MSGFGFCSKHGRNSGFQSYIDKKICDAIDEYVLLKSEDLQIINTLIFTGEDEFPVFSRNYLFTKETIAKYNLKTHYILEEKEDEKGIEILDQLTGGRFGCCFREYMNICNLGFFVNKLNEDLL